jgi:succinate dehydrogenase/fumarate reductase flavoprotein subunit
LRREESRGAHQRTDHPMTDPALDHHHTVIGADERPAPSRWR